MHINQSILNFLCILKAAEQQAALSIHRTRDLLVKQRTQLVNMIRGLLAEFGIDIPQGIERALLMARRVADGEAPDLPVEAIKVVLTLSQQVLEIHGRVREMERDLQRWHRGNELSQRLATIPGIGPIGASALAASVTDPHQFRSGRQFAAWLGLTPLQKSSGGKERLGRITKMGDKYLRKLMIVGMTSLVRRAKYKPESVDPRLANWLARKPVRVATVAMANKAARVIWVIMTRGESYRAGHVPAFATQ
jgi:transposase